MKNNHKKVTMATALVLLTTQLMTGNVAEANGQIDSQFPILDGYWDSLGLNEDSDNNYVGVDEYLGEQKSAIQFDLTTIDKTFTNVKLKVYINTLINNSNNSGLKPSVTLYGSSYTNWDEGDFPMKESDPKVELDSDDTNLVMNQWKEFDVTDYIDEQLDAGRATITFALVSRDPNLVSFGYAADETDKTLYPRLEFEYPTPPPPPAVLHAPTITDSETTEDHQSELGLSILPYNGEEIDAAYYQISGIHGGTLYQNDGTMEIAEGTYITKDQVGSNLKFTPNRDANTPAGDTFGFTVKAARDSAGAGLSDGVSVDIPVSEVNDQPETTDDTLTAVAKNAGERTIPFSELLQNDKSGPDNESTQSLTITSVSRVNGGNVQIVGKNVIFTPDPNFSGLASFEYTAMDDGTTDGESDPQQSTTPGIVSFTIQAPADMPTVTDATTEEDKQTNDLVINPTIAGGASTTHFKITGITGGRLYQNNGVIPIEDGDYITVADGQAGLKFTPSPNAYGTTGFGFNVQAAPGTTGTLLSEAVHASITVSEVNDAPTAVEDQLPQVKMGTAKVTIPFRSLTDNDQAGPNEDDQTLTVVDVSQPHGGTVSINNGQVEFVPDANFQGEASFTYNVIDNGTTNTAADPLTATARAKFDVQPTEKPVIQLSGSDVYVLIGQTYVDPGFSAVDEDDQDLTDEVRVSGQLNTSQLGTYILHYNVSDRTGNAATEVTRNVHVVSADLDFLTVNSGTYTPVYDRATSTYTLDVPNRVNSISVSTATFDPSATVTVEGSQINTGESSTLNVRDGRNEYTIVVTANGGSTHTYTLKVTRQAEPVPAPSPGHSTTIPEQQQHLNDQAKEAMKDSKDGEWINKQVVSALEHLSDVVEPSDVNDSTKLDLVANTVNDVFKPLMDKWEQGVISRSQLNKLLDTFLEDGLNKVMDHVDLKDEEVFKKGTDTVNALIEKVIAKLDDAQVKGSVADQVGSAMNRLLESKNAIRVQNHGEVDGISDQLKQIDTMIKSWSKDLGSKADMFDLERHLIVNVEDETGEKSLRATQANTITEPTVSFKKETVKALGDRGFVVTVKNEDGASMKLPTSFFIEYKREDLVFIVEANKEAKVPSSYVKASEAYQFKILAANKEISSLSKGTVLINIPYEFKSKSLSPYSYDSKRKMWKQVTASKSQPLDIEKVGDVMQFSTTSLQTYMLAEVGMRSIAVDKKSLKLEPGANQQLKVTGSLSGGRKVDLSTEEDGTTYTSSKPDHVTVDENGLISVSPDAKSGTKATITVKNGKSTAKLSVTVYTLKSLAISPSITSVPAGKKLQLKVYAVYSDRSRVDVSKGSTGTTYSLEENEFVTISTDGLLTIREDAPDGTLVSIKVMNNKVSATYTVKVKNR
ncbi:Ig-like domain-containing protein [Brevibacillus centrosporus]|uniref:Ig-like domain-containing protein n=1 Tax=Brevibacillus centrosporus TaxID=54910 RepID=UPI003B016059